MPIVPPDAYEAIPPAPPEINRPETLIELGPFRTATSLPTLQAPLTLPPIHEASLPESQTVSWWGVIGRVLAFMLTLALLTFLFKRIWLLWALVWAASILGLISWHRQRHPKYGPIGGILEFNYEIVLGVLWLLGNFILAFIGFV
ncbi:MAG: hypothetical protein DLM69_06525 [Candidatus Chloroheliales bacterium]|nr:MAG: hypothetical protein DLM69_06525 [Chloroflexota bacterium]